MLALAIVLTDNQPLAANDRELRKMDPTTDLPTRGAVSPQAEETFNHDPCAQWALLRLKIEGMRPINQALGQDLGDHALRQAAGRLLRSLAESECVGRVGGNEFILLIRHKSDDYTVERIQKKKKCSR